MNAWKSNNILLNSHYVKEETKTEIRRFLKAKESDKTHNAQHRGGKGAVQSHQRSRESSAKWTIAPPQGTRKSKKPNLN